LNFNDFIQTIKNNDIHSVENFLINNDLNHADQQRAFIFACNKGRTVIVKLFLKNKRVNPAYQNNKAFINACYNGKLGIVKLLLNDKRVNPADQNNQAFIRAILIGKIYIIKMFLKHKIYSFDFDFENKEEFYFLKKIYPTLNKDVNKYLTSSNNKHIIIELQKHLISDKISTF
jgi:ankyrin repeat protein